MSASVPPQFATQPRFKGRSLIVMRAIWIVGFLILLGVTLAALPAYHQTVTTICDQAADPAACRALIEQAGLSESVRGWVFSATHLIMIAAYFLSGIVIYWQLSDQRLAFLTSLAMMGFVIAFAGDVLTLVNRNPDLRIPLLILRVLCRAQLMALLFYFPSGRFVPRWSFWLLIASVIANTLVVVLGLENGRMPQVVTLVNTLIGLGAQIYRYRRVSTDTERLQTKWVLLGLASNVIAAIIFFGSRIAFPNVISQNFLPPVSLIDVWYWVTLGSVGVLLLTAFPISIALAVLRYRLWGAEALINRGLVYGGVTVLLGGVFVIGLLLLNRLLERVLGGQQEVLAAIISTGLVVGLFQPTLTYLRRLVDRRLYRINVDYRRRLSHARSSAIASTHLQTPMGIYQNLQPIAQGGMAELYRAEHPSLGRPVAIKILLSKRLEMEEYRIRFEREAKAVAALKHPNIVQLYDYGATDDGTMYMVMEYINGSDLSRFIADHGPLPLDEIRPIVADIASALDYAHALGIVHRDVKPANVMLEPVTQVSKGRQYRAVLTDFGLVKINDVSTQMTTSAGVMGTLDYIAPEQIEAEPRLDGRADIYALGAMTFEMLTGTQPFKASNALAILMMHMHEPPPDLMQLLPDLPDTVCAAVHRAMAKKPDQRYATAGDFAAALG